MGARGVKKSGLETHHAEIRRMTGARDLLFGMLALQNGLIDQGQLVAAFQSWTRSRERPLAEHLVARGDLDPEQRAGVDAMVSLHLKKHGGDAERSLAAVPAGRSTREGLSRVSSPDIEASLAHLGADASRACDDADQTAAYSVGMATSDGQRFRVLRPHARGGLGAVFVALDNELHREVALKQILDKHADDPNSRARFLLEAEVTGGLEHPGIVPVYGLGTYDNGRPYYAMRFVEGDSLKEAIARFHGDEALKGDPGQRGLELRQLLRRFVDVCNAIEYAHSRGVLHRDIKPGNVIVGKHGETLVVDWGLAKAQGRELAGERSGERPLVPSSASGSTDTLPGLALGTPSYMSPEQSRGELDRLGPRSDVYSLGATLYCLLTGKQPFEGEGIADVLRAVQRGEFKPPREHVPSIDKALEAICLKAMALKPEDRYSSCKALVDDIEHWMADQPVAAWREPWTRSLVRWLTRNRTIVTGAAAAMLMALAGLAAVSAVQARANGELRNSNDALTTANIHVGKANAELQEANDNTTRANQELQAASVRERQRFELAMDAIKLFHGEISKDLLLKQRDFEKLRGRLLHAAADFYGRLEGLLKDRKDRASRQALGRAYEQLGALTIDIGNSKEALAIVQKAISVRRELVAETDSDDANMLDLARSVRNSGVLLASMSNLEAAMAAYNESLALVQPLKPAARMSEPVYRVAAMATLDIGWLNHLLGKEEESVTWMRKACDILEKGIASNPSAAGSAPDKESLLFLVSSLNSLGGPLAAMGNKSEILSDQSRALELTQKLVDAYPDDPTVLISRAATYLNIGAADRGVVRSADAFSAFRSGLVILDKLVKDYPAIIEYRRSQGRCLNGCGYAAQELGRPDEALAYFRRALSVWQEAVAANPERSGGAIEVARMQNGIGWILYGSGKMSEALQHYEAAQSIFQKLMNTFPLELVPRTRSELANTLINIAELGRRQGRLAEARVNCDAAIAMREALVKDFPEVLSYRIGMGESLMRLGQVKLEAGDIAGAAADWRRGIARHADYPRYGGEIAMLEAGCHAQLSSLAGLTGSGVSADEGRAEQDKAMFILRQAVADGYRGRELRHESCLEPLRSRPDFQMLLMDVVFPPVSFAP
jgi:serine/threonine protein kinase/tetratricopeptide (TPR) repeat protein